MCSLNWRWRMRIIAIANQKGGCGKTTTAINLSSALSVNKRKTLLIDFDPQAHATIGLNVNSDKSLYNVLSSLTNKKLKIEDVILKIDKNLDLIPSNILLGTIEQELADQISRESRLFDVLANLSITYDYIIIDCPPNLGLLTVNAIRAAKEVYIPVETSYFSLAGLNHLVEIIELIKDRLNHSVDYRVLVTIFDSRLKYSFKILDTIKRNFKDSLFDTIIHTNVKLKESQSQGCSVLDFDKYSRGSKDYFSLAREVISQEKPQLRTIEEMVKPEMDKFIKATFSFVAPDAKTVYVAGEFNNWARDDTSLLENKQGVWMRQVTLKPGTYRYRFVVDDNWKEDPNNPENIRNPFGELDSVIELK